MPGIACPRTSVQNSEFTLRRLSALFLSLACLLRLRCVESTPAPQLLGAAAPSCQHRECTRSCRCVAAQALDRFHQLQPSSSDSRSHVPKKGSQLMCIRRTQKRFRVRLIALALKVSCAPDCTCLESLGVACFNSLAHWRFLGSRLPGADRSLLSRVGLGMADASRTISQCQVGESILIPRPVWLSPLSGACDLCRCFRAEATPQPGLPGCQAGTASVLLAVRCIGTGLGLGLASERN